MKRSRYIVVFFIFVLTAGRICCALTETETKEYQLKAAFLYNFIKFVDWPAKVSDSNEITIAVISKEPLAGLFEPLKDKKVKNKTCLVKQIPSFEEIQTLSKQNKKAAQERIESMKKCHLLFISSSEAAYIKDILNQLKGTNVLTVSEIDNFLNEGGMINFVEEEKKLRFEINLDSSDKAKLKISSQLLQLAKKVVKSKDAS